jgi:hypothetical protein
MQSKKLFKNIEQKSCIPWLPILNYFTLLVNEWYVCGQLNEKSTLMPNFNLVLTLFPHLVGSVQHVFHHVVIKIRQLFLRRAACMTSTLHETGVGANDCKCSRDCLTYLPNKGVWPKFIISVTHPMTDLCERCLASAIARRAHCQLGTVKL